MLFSNIDTTPIACRTRKQMIQYGKYDLTLFPLVSLFTTLLKAPPALRTRARKRMVQDGKYDLSSISTSFPFHYFIKIDYHNEYNYLKIIVNL